MNPNLIAVEADLVVIGVSARTSPERAAADIPALWQRFAASAPGDGPVYAVYCDYESDFSGPYTLVLGRAVGADAVVPAGARRVRVPAGRYARFEASGDPKAVIWQTWQQINGSWAQRSQRRYIADYEKYVGALAEDGSVRAEVMVGLG